MRELEAYILRVRLLEEFIERDKKADEKVEELHDKELSLAAKEVELERAEKEVWKEKAEFYQNAFEEIQKKKMTFGCFMKKVFTLGLGACRK